MFKVIGNIVTVNLLYVMSSRHVKATPVLCLRRKRIFVLPVFAGCLRPRDQLNTKDADMEKPFAFTWRHYQSVALWRNQAAQPIPGYFSGNRNCHYKTYEIKRKQKWKPGEDTFATPGCEVYLKYQFTNSGARNCGITDFGKQTKWRPERSGAFRVKYGYYLVNLDIGHPPEIYSEGIYLNSDIWHFIICKIRRESCCDTTPIRSRNFPSSQCKQNHEYAWDMPKYVKIFSHLALYF